MPLGRHYRSVNTVLTQGFRFQMLPNGASLLHQLSFRLLCQEITSDSTILSLFSDFFFFLLLLFLLLLFLLLTCFISLAVFAKALLMARRSRQCGSSLK